MRKRDDWIQYSRAKINCKNAQIHCWPNQDPAQALIKYLDTNSNERSWIENCGRYLSLTLPELSGQRKWLYHDWLGFIRE